MNEKLIIVFYFNVDGMITKDIESYITTICVELTAMEKELNMKYMVIPVTNQPTKVECINPIFIDSDELEKLKIKATVRKCVKLVHKSNERI